jgi:hypothetical protein
VRLLLTILLVPGFAWGQLPRVASIDIYGTRKIPRERILTELKVGEGDRLPASKGDLEERLEQLSEVAVARVEALCCTEAGVQLFVGIAERGGPHFAFRSAPRDESYLPDDMVETYRGLVRAMEDAGRRGRLQQDLTNGHALMVDPEGRALQEKLRSLMPAHLKLVRGVLRNSANEEHRAIAATAIGYAPQKARVVNDLMYALQDPSENVRANAVRSLEAIAVMARLKPELEIKISPTWFIEMLNSLSLSDRQRAAAALVTLTDGGAPDALQQIRERAWDSVVEMAGWHSLRHAVPAFVLLGRMAGMSEGEIEKSWSLDREQTIRQIMNAARKAR